MRIIVFESADAMLNIDELIAMGIAYEHSIRKYKFELKGGKWLCIPTARYTLDAIREAIATVQPYNPCGVEESLDSEGRS
jgi:hypothetical protein